MTSSPSAAPVKPAPSASAPAPASSETSSSARPLDDFPLARHYGSTNADGSPVEVTSTPGLDKLAMCHEGLWTPDEGPIDPVDLVGATWTRTSGDEHGITLARYGDAGEAAYVMAYVRRGVEVCPEDGDLGTAYQGQDRRSGDEGFVITQRGAPEHDAADGLVVYDLVRVDDLLLVSWSFREDPGTAETVRLVRLGVTVRSDDLVPEMCAYAATPCSDWEPTPVIAIGPDGIEDLTLGMAADTVKAHGLVPRQQQTRSDCSDWVARREGHSVWVNIREGFGIVTMWVGGADVITPEGVGTGSLARDVVAAYPQVEGEESLLTAAVPGRPRAAYWFWIGGGGVVNDVMLMLPDDRCYG